MLANGAINPLDAWLEAHPIKETKSSGVGKDYLRVVPDMSNELPAPSSPPSASMAPWSYYVAEAVNASRFANASKAEYFWLAALQIAECFGANDSRLAYTLDNAMCVCIASGKDDEALKYGQRALSIMQNLYGKKDLRAVNCMNNLAGIYYRQGLYAAAESLAVQVLTAYNKNLGKTHALIGLAAQNLAMTYQAQENYNLAELMYERALPIQKSSLGLTHPQVGALMENYANVLAVLGRDDKCELVRAELRGSGIWHKFDPHFSTRLTA